VNDEAPVLVEKRGRLGLLTLNRPSAINALTHEMVHILQTTLNAWTEDEDVACVLVHGAGDRGLCAGGDIVSIHRDAISGGTGTEEFWRDEYRLNATIANYPKPYIAFMDGIVLGGGVGVSAHGSHRVVTDRTKIGMPEVGIGYVPDVGGTWLLSHAPGELGTYIALTAGHVDGADAVEVGLADHLVSSTSLDELISLLQEHPADQAIDMLATNRAQASLSQHRPWIDAAFSADDVPTIMEALAARPEPAAQEALASLTAKSPTSLVVTLRALRAARGLTLEEALAQEYRIAVRMLRGHDFPEGIRAQVIDKDRNPRWQPDHVDLVRHEDVAAYFAPLDTNELVLTSTTRSNAEHGGTA
jgi:enoyl-CoA hydratase